MNNTIINNTTITTMMGLCIAAMVLTFFAGVITENIALSIVAPFICGLMVHLLNVQLIEQED